MVTPFDAGYHAAPFRALVENYPGDPDYPSTSFRTNWDSVRYGLSGRGTARHSAARSTCQQSSLDDQSRQLGISWSRCAAQSDARDEGNDHHPARAVPRKAGTADDSARSCGIG